MLNDLDDTIREVLIREGGFDPNRISFETPDREWSAEVYQPTLNCYLFDIHERRLFREEGWQIEQRGQAGARRRLPPIYFELTYLITAWTQRGNIRDEHYLLWRALTTLVRFPLLKECKGKAPDDLSAEPLQACLQGSLIAYPWPIYTSIAQVEGVLKSPGEFWTALENQLKPSLSYVVTVALDREKLAVGEPILNNGISIRLPDAPADQEYHIDRLITRPENVPLEDIIVAVEQTNIRTTTNDKGMFKLTGLPAGAHTLRIEAGGQVFHCVVMLHGFRVNRVFPLPPGTPLKGIDVAVKDKDDNEMHKTTTDDQGMFRLEGLDPGNYVLEVTIDGQAYQQHILLRDPNERSVAPFRDMIRDQAGNPIPNVQVEVEELGLQTKTNPKGEFSFDLPPGSYTLVIHFASWTERRRISMPVYRQRLHYGGASAP